MFTIWLQFNWQKIWNYLNRIALTEKNFNTERKLLILASKICIVFTHLIHF